MEMGDPVGRQDRVYTHVLHSHVVIDPGHPICQMYG